MKLEFSYLVIMGAILFYLFSVARGMRKGTYYKLPRAFRIVSIISLVFILTLISMAMIGSLISPHH
jgi:hypothetical protein